MQSPEREIRRQLSLFVPPHTSTKLEELRSLLDPVQQSLIPAHVTLCREDELADLSGDQLQERLRRAWVKPLTLRFGRPEAFASHGILLHCVDGEQEFHQLRELLLGTTMARLHRPHITLAHPRNPRAPGNSLANTSRLPVDLVVTFDTVSWIEQVGHQPWKLLEVFSLVQD